MTPVLLALALLAAPPLSTGDRIAESAAAAQALQGPLDGTWILADPRGRPLYVIQIVDPVEGGAALQAAWRAPGRDGALGEAAARRHGRRLSLRLDDQGARVSLRQTSRDVWRGVLRRGGRARPVFLRRP